MELRGVTFSRVFLSSGAVGFDGKGYWYHRLMPRPLYDCRGATKTMKTTTWLPRTGNMPLKSDGVTPREFKPKCIVVYPKKGIVGNAVGLSGPGAVDLMSRGIWQQQTENFSLSIMPMGDASQHASEMCAFDDLLDRYLSEFRAKAAIEINYSCPNVGKHYDDLRTQVLHDLEIIGELNRPVILNFNALLPIELAVRFSEHPACDAISIANSMPWGACPDLIDWKGTFGTDVSPLADLGGGGWSGSLILPALLDWLTRARYAGIRKPVIAGGGIMSVADADTILRVGFPIVQAIKLGVVGMLRPWRVQKIIRFVNGNAHKFSRHAIPPPFLRLAAS